MGNGVTKVSHCFVINGEISRRHDIAVYIGDPLSQESLGLGHSFCYIRPEPTAARRLSNASNKIHSDETTPSTTTSFFRSISGASVSANTSTPPSTSLLDSCPYSSGLDMASSAFESSDSFTSIPLQPVPRGTGRGALSGPIERGFLSGPIERGFLSGPIDRGSYYSSSSGPVEKEKQREIVIENSNSNKLKRSFSHGGGSGGLEMEQIITKPKKGGLMKALKKALSKTISRSFKAGVKKTAPVSGDLSGKVTSSVSHEVGEEDEEEEREGEYSDFSIGGSQNLQWAQGKAGEDRMHIIVSEEKGWVFVGIYDGFNGPDAPDYLLSNLYSNVHKELKGLLWDDGFEMEFKSGEETGEDGVSGFVGKENWGELGSGDVESGAKGRRGKGLRYKRSNDATRRNRWSCEWDRERVELDWKSKEKLNCEGGSNVGKVANHSHVLKALSEALRKTEEEYFQMADTMAGDNPELALMGSCVLVMLMKGEDVYLMNVGDSRAVLAQSGDTDLGGLSQNLEMIHEERLRDVEVLDGGNEFCTMGNLRSLQLTMDHSTYVDKEVERIKREHPDDASAIMNDRVKGYLKVTRAFGVGFLKQPKWNDQLLEMFRIDYIGTSPYIICSPFLYHHRLTSRDRFLILSSDGLYQYFTNEEVVGEVESFISTFPEGDPAQHLIEEVLFRAAKKAGMDFHELLDVPQGDRRRYHDDVSVIIISLEGRIWRSSV